MPEGNVIAAAVFGLFVLYILSRVFYQPLRILLRIGGHLLIGGGLIVVYNLAGSVWNLTIGLNPISALVVGLMGLPGLVMLVVLRHLLG